MNQRPIRILFGAIVVLGLFSSCPSPFQKSDLTAGFDEEPPVITLTSPSDGDSYGSALLVTGTVHDSAPDGDGEVASLSCAVVSLMAGTQVTNIEDDGSFQFLVDCGGFSGSIVLQLTARDWNGNETTTNVNLVDAVSDIPSFSLTPGNGKIDVTWDAVTGATGYTLYEYVSGFSTHLTTDVTTYEYNGPADEPLRNGGMVLLQLKAEMDGDYRDAWSDTDSCVPLSEFTLMPFTRSGDGTVEVEWYDAPAVDLYTVLRSASRDPATFTVLRIVNGNSIVDTDVIDGQTYFYRVQPNSQNDILSGMVPGTPQSIPEAGIINTGIVPSQMAAPVRALAGGTDLFVIGRYGAGSTSLGDVEWFDNADPNNPDLVDSLGLDFDDDPQYFSSKVPWDALRSDMNDVGRIFISTQTDEKDIDGNEVGSYNGFVVVDSSGSTLIEGNNYYEWNSELRFAVVGDVFYYVDTTAINEFYYVDMESFDLFNMTWDVANVSGTQAEGSGPFASLNFNTPLDIVSYNDGTTDHLFVIDDDADGTDISLAHQLNLFTITLDNTSHLPTAATVLGSDIFATAIADNNPGWDDPSNGTCELLYVIAENDTLVVVVQTPTTTTYYGAAVYDISTPTAPVYEGAFMIRGASEYLGKPAVDGDTLIVPDVVGNEIRIYDIGSSNFSKLLQVISTPGGYPFSALVAEGRYYIPADSGGTYVMRNAVPGGSSPTTLSPAGVPTPGYVVIDGDRAYLTGSDGKLYVLDSSAPASPTFVSSLNLGLPTVEDFQTNSGILSLGDYLAVVNGTTGVTFVDVSSPASPQIGSTILEDSIPSGLMRYGDVLFVSSRIGGVYAYDISEPDTPALVATTTFAGKPWGQARFGSTLLYNLDSSRVATVDVSDPYNPEVLDTELLLNGSAIPTAAATLDDYGYVGFIENGGDNAISIGVIDIKTPDILTDLTDADIPITIQPDSNGIIIPVALLPVSDNLLVSACAFLSEEGLDPAGDSDGAVQLFTLDNPDSPGYVMGIDIAPTLTSADWFGNWGYFADPVEGLVYLNLGQ